ncbi:glycoside hydrolase family 12 protein [Astrocystis sublimbata]|nr:glycoside hydrolase family 12 protein [Astrocystis sublimbata]
MKSQLLTLVALSPLAAYALPKHARNQRKCGGKPPVSATTTITTGIPLSSISTFSVVPIESLTFDATTYSTDYMTQTPTTTVTTGLPLSEVPSFTDVPANSIPKVSTYSTYYLTVSPTTTVTTGLPLSEVPSFTEVPNQDLPTSTFATYTITAPVESPSASATQVTDGTYPVATPMAYKVQPTEQCGNDDRLILPGMPWTVANSMYNADEMVGKQCTNFDGILENTEGTKEVKYTSVTDVKLIDDTKDVCKGYTNVGIGVNLNKKLKDIKSIPAYYKWDRKITSDFRGSNLFDFVTAPTPHDFTSTATSEFMLWIRNWGNQVPIGYSRGPVATLDMFGASWKLYEGKNPASGVTVRSMLVDENYEGEFRGDLKEWLDYMVKKGYISDNDYVNVGNAGTEIFYGKSTMDATVALNIEI